MISKVDCHVNWFSESGPARYMNDFFIGVIQLYNSISLTVTKASCISFSVFSACLLNVSSKLRRKIPVIEQTINLCHSCKSCVDHNTIKISVLL